MKRPRKWVLRRTKARGTLPAVLLEGPGVVDLVVEVIEQIADVASYDDGFNDRWLAYVMARRAVTRGMQELVDDDTADALHEELAGAQADVLDDLPTSIRLHLPDARAVGDLLFEETGRVGAVAP